MNQILLAFLLIVGLLILSALLFFTADEIEYTKTYKPPQSTKLTVHASKPTLSIAEFKKMVGPTYLQRVQAMESQDNTIRRNALTAILDHAGIGYRIHDSGKDGKHIVLDEVGGGDGLFLIFAHYDTVGGVEAQSSATYGANDNLSCVSAAIGSYLQLHANKPENVRVRFVFPDLEEIGRTPVGSKAYASEADFEGYIGALSMELCGTGNPDGSAGTAIFWDRTGGFEKTELFRLAVEAMESVGIPHRNEVSSKHSSDHNNFQRQPFSKLGGSFGFVMMADELRDRMNYFDNIYHTKGDVSEKLHEPNMARAANAITQIVYRIDKARSTSVDK
jgi:Zn-dependent M28 family amino/carboxypeptidase